PHRRQGWWLGSARGESRTHTGLPPGDFESPASAIPPLGRAVREPNLSCHADASHMSAGGVSRITALVRSGPRSYTGRAATQGRALHRSHLEHRGGRACISYSNGPGSGPARNALYAAAPGDRKSTRLKSSQGNIQYVVFSV